MTAQLQVGNKTIQADEVLCLLHRYQLMPQVLRGLVIDQALSQWERSANANDACTEVDRQAAIAAFCQQHQLTSSEAWQAWLEDQGLTLEQMEELAIRPMLLAKFKAATWGPKVGSHFLKRKTSLDQVVYSLIRTQDRGLARELYFRIQAGEQSFADLAREYSQGPETNTGGSRGPVPLSQVHPVISRLLSISQPGQLRPPFGLGEWFVIIRLEELLPAKLDERMHRHLIDELFENWLHEQVQQVGA